MLKPITKEEKLRFTLQIQAEKATDEVLFELYEANYNGFVDLWPEIKTTKGQVILEMRNRSVPLISSAKSHPSAVRYHVLPGKGCKRIK